jgi:Mrp family chromosome partitioning ATPase
MLGIGLAFARDALDTRVRSADDVGDELGIPLLARLPAPRKNLRKTNALVMMADPRGHQSEAFRMLRSNLEFVNLDRGARSILVTSALEKEGKSTTVSNLAVTLARAGKRVVLVDLDLRRPAVRQFFGIDADHPGVTNVVLGQVALEQALVDVFHTTGDGGVDYMDRLPSNGNGHGSPTVDVPSGVLAVLVAGASPPDPGEFVGSPRMARLLADLALRFDFVLIDTPPLLSVGDAMTLSAHVDGMIAVARLELLKRPVLQELARALATCPSLKLGYIVTGAEAEAGYGQTGYQYYDRADGYDVNLPLPTTQSEAKV